MANAIGWVQVRLAGGAKSIGILTGLYAAIVCVFLIVQLRFSYSTRSTAESWCSILLYIQMAALVLFGNMRVIGSIRNDSKLGMMESHRMMPITGIDAVLGYVGAPAIQLIPFTLVNIGLGMALALQAGLSTMNLVMSHALIWSMAIVLWLIMALGALVARQGAVLLTIPVLIAFLSQGIIVVLFPSVLVLVTPLIGDGVLTLNRIHSLNAGQMVALVLQLIVGAQFFFAAARKYQYAEWPAFDGLRGLLLLCTWVGLYLVAVLDKEDFRMPHIFREFQDESMAPVHLIATLLAALLVALVPIGSAARRAQAGTWKGLSPLTLLVLAIIVAVLPVFGILLDPPEKLGSQAVSYRMLTGNIGHTILIVSAFVLTMYNMLRMMPQNKPILRINLVTLWLGFSWLIPLVIELIFQAVINDSDQLRSGRNTGGPSALMAMSPLGALVEVWCMPRVTQPWPGVVVQWGGVLLFALLLWWSKKKAKAKVTVGAMAPAEPVSVSETAAH